MPRTWARKTNRGVDANVLETEAKEIIKRTSVRAVARKHGNRYWKKYKQLKDQNSDVLLYFCMGQKVCILAGCSFPNKASCNLEWEADGGAWLVHQFSEAAPQTLH